MIGSRFIRDINLVIDYFRHNTQQALAKSPVKKVNLFSNTIVMSEEARKLNLISALLTEKDEQVLNEIETILLTKKMKAVGQLTFKDFAGILSHEESNEMKRVIEESCEQIDPNDWK